MGQFVTNKSIMWTLCIEIYVWCFYLFQIALYCAHLEMAGMYTLTYFLDLLFFSSLLISRYIGLKITHHSGQDWCDDTSLSEKRWQASASASFLSPLTQPTNSVYIHFRFQCGNNITFQTNSWKNYFFTTSIASMTYTKLHSGLCTTQYCYNY